MPKELLLYGSVQGVFCRYYCSQNAKRLGIRGSATNLPNGTVQVLLDTNDDEITKEFVKAIRENTFGYRFYGHISRVLINNYNGTIKGDYIF